MSPEQDQLAMALARVEVRLESMQSDVSEIKEQVKETNGRVTTLEGWRSKVTGFLAAIALLGPIISGVTTALLVSHLT